MQFAKDNITSVATQNFRLRDQGSFTHFVRVSKDEFTRFQWALVRVGSGNTAALDCGMADSIFEPKSFFFMRENMTILPPDRGDAGQLLVGLARPLERCLQMFRVWRECGHYHVDIRQAERLLPVFRALF